MKFPAICIFVLFFSLGTVAQVRQDQPTRTPRPVITLTGQITDSLSGAPLNGASINFSDVKVGAIAGEDGKFIVRNLPAGHYLVEVSSVGYTAAVEHIDITTTTQRNFRLKPAIIENRGVTVTGVTSSMSTRNTPVPVTIVRRSALMEQASTNLIDALSKQPGISQISTGPAISKPVIRGLSYNRVVVMNDGQRQEGQQWGDEHGIEIDEQSVQRVEILKGAASLVYGSDAIGGVLHVITNVPVTEGTMRGNILSSYQTNNKQANLHANLAGNKNGFNWNAYGSYKSAGDYKNDFDGRVLNSRFNERNFGGYIGLNKSWGYSHLILSSFNQKLGIVEGTRDSATGRFLIYPESPLEAIATPEQLNERKVLEPNQGVQHYRITSDNSLHIGRSRLKLNLGFQDNIRREFGNPEDPKETELHFDLKSGTYNVQWQIPESAGLQTTLGVSGMYQQNKNLGEEAIIPDYNLFDAGGFLFGQKTFDHATITGGVRYDNRKIRSELMTEGTEIKFEAFERNFSNISASFGVSYYPVKNLTLKGNIARGFRAPTLSELASNGAHEGTNRFEYGTRDLESERSLQLDAGIDLDFDHVSFSLSGFYNNIHDYIFYRRVSSAAGGDSIVIQDGEELQAFRYDQGNAQLRGFEFSSDLHPHPLDWLHFVNGFSIVRGMFAEAIENTRNLPTIPAAHWTSEIRVRLVKSSKHLRTGYAMVELDKTFRQNKPFLAYNTETATKGYGLLNAGAGGMITNVKGKDIFEWHFSVNNITDEGYQNHLNRLKYADVNNATGRQGVYGMGRNFTLKVNVPLKFNIGRAKE